MNRLLVKLTDDEILKAKALALSRNNTKRQKTYNDKRGSLIAHLIGVLGEMAVAKYLGLAVDERVLARGDTGFDLQHDFFGHIQVKTTTHDPPWLLLEVKKVKQHSKVNTFFLCYYNISEESMWIVGFIKQENIVVTERKPRKCSKFGPLNYIIKEEELFKVC